MEIFKVVLPNGTRVWAGDLNGSPFVALNESKMVEFFQAIGLGIPVDTNKEIPYKEFLEMAKSHPVLNIEKNWPRMLGVENSNKGPS